MALPGIEIRRYIEELVNEEDQVQPGGVDLTILKISTFEEEGEIGFAHKKLPKTKEIKPINGYWKLPPGPYKITYNEIVKIPENAIGICLPRSSLLRMGATIFSAVWDPGYMGRGEGLLVVFNPNGIRIQERAKIAQLILIKLSGKPHKVYRGTYYGENINLNKL